MIKKIWMCYLCASKCHKAIIILEFRKWMCILHKFLNNFHLLWIIIVHLSMSTKDMHFVYKESGIFVMWKALESFLCVLRFFSLFKHLFQINQCWMLNDKPQLHCMQWVNKNSHFPSKSYLWRISYKIKKLLPCDEKFGFAWFNNKKDYPITHTYLTLTTFSGFPEPFNIHLCTVSCIILCMEILPRKWQCWQGGLNIFNSFRQNDIFMCFCFSFSVQKLHKLILILLYTIFVINVIFW